MNATRGAAVVLGCAAVGVSAVAGPAIWGSPRVVAWRWRHHFEDLRYYCTATLPGPDGPTRAEYAALRLLALERLRAPDAKARADGCRALDGLHEIGAGASTAEAREEKLALAEALADRRTVAGGEVASSEKRRQFRVCDAALIVAGRPGCVTVSAEATDRACAEARAEIEKELTSP